LPAKKAASQRLFCGWAYLQKPWARGALLARIFRAIEPVGQHEQAKNHEHDDEDVFDFHGCSFGRQGVGLKKELLIMLS
jgi:hypothetical protein